MFLVFEVEERDKLYKEIQNLISHKIPPPPPPPPPSSSSSSSSSAYSPSSRGAAKKSQFNSCGRFYLIAWDLISPHFCGKAADQIL